LTGSVNRDRLLVLTYIEAAKPKSEMAKVYRDLCRLYTGGRHHECNCNQKE
jgi:hypothetical protein